MLTEPQILEELLRREKVRKLYRLYGQKYDHSRPFGPDNQGVYAWQMEFHNAGLANAERALIAANRVGKTQTGSAEVACHMTGWYPDWWEGRKFNEPILAWTGCETAELSRDVVQLALLGKDGEHGTGWIPGEEIKKVSYRQAGVNNVVDTITVRHKSGGLSTCTLKTYRAGAGGDVARRVWQGAACHVIWLDEECPRVIYTEAQTRLLDNNGRMIATWTPLIGQTWLVGHYMGLEPDVDDPLGDA